MGLRLEAGARRRHRLLTVADLIEPWDFADAQAEFTPAQRTVLVCFDGTIATEIDDLTVKLADYEGDDAGATALAERLASLHEQVKAKARPFVVQAIGDRWRDVVDQHPPTPEQAMMGLGFNGDTLPPAGVAACCVSPAMTLEQATWMFENLALGQWRRLWNAVLDLNVAGEDGLGKSLSGTARLLLSARNSTTASPTESPGVSSLEDV
jgi:hypothetical protein